MFLAGILFHGVTSPEDAAYLVMNPALYQGAFIFPQGGGRARAYLAYPVTGHRLQGEGDIPKFIDEFARTGARRDFLTGPKPIGPLASFETADTWAPHPCGCPITASAVRNSRLTRKDRRSTLFRRRLTTLN